MKRDIVGAAVAAWSRRVGRFVAAAPLTYAWLTALLVTTLLGHAMPAARLHALLASDSTNLHHLARDPERVLLTSLFWIDGRYWWPYLLLFSAILAPAERWLGWWRWLTVGLVAHVLATYLSEAYLYWTIAEAQASPRLIDARDIGVSYFLVGVAGALTYRIPRPWQWIYLGAIAALATAALIARPDFTQLGHLCALLIGLGCYPVVRSRLDRPPPPAA
ncbi:rhomboid-like protein [Mycobacterium sp. WMMD1722]|uniref:rhomboid-like protein n=1 Tax=Mycobacterium sp. WMMD1722 TaxID=3404117 RepID=UPI003BF5EE6A